MSAKDGNTELMPPVLGGDEVAALIPERVTEVHAHERQDAPQPAIPHPTSPFLDVHRAPSFQEWSAKWVAAFSAVAEGLVAVPGSNGLVAKGRRYARAQGRTVGDVEALELGCWLATAENLDQVEHAVLQSQPADLSACIQVALHGLAALYVREHGGRL
ncbi:MAG TPA: hypothetical protein VGS97_19985 [Actinocrinis sp.]|uniref:hypothetical protein n=1 Tax=Actinocrinis sp. TaxID=1920516 RepID=UPI002DDD42DC|nr:hypothetical protein [Actinocrinis sp.]HEV2346389.1 hypothetical protein [Actinocrinis sp.]